MRTIFLDTVGLLAMCEANDRWHAAAMEAFARITDESTVYTTTSLVLFECENAAARKPYRNDVVILPNELESVGRPVSPTREDGDAGWKAYQRGEAGQAGIVDQISCAVMRRLGVQQAFTNDRHFGAAGFETLFGARCCVLTVPPHAEALVEDPRHRRRPWMQKSFPLSAAWSKK